MILPFSNSVSIMSTHFATRILRCFRHGVYILDALYSHYCFVVVVVVVVVSFLWIDY